MLDEALMKTARPVQRLRVPVSLKKSSLLNHLDGVRNEVSVCFMSYIILLGGVEADSRKLLGADSKN